MAKQNKRLKPTNLKIGDKVWIEDGEDSGEYEIAHIELEDDNCWLVADIPSEDDPEETRSVEQEFPLSWIEQFHAEQNGA